MGNNLKRFLGKAIDKVKENWQDFLQTFAYICKNGSINSILIYAQDQSARMVATKDGWKAYGRALRYGAKAIFTIQSVNPHKLAYVFKYKDTFGKDVEDIFRSKELMVIEDVEIIINDYFLEKENISSLMIESVKNMVFYRLYELECTQKYPDLGNDELISYVHQVGIHSFQIYKIVKSKLSAQGKGENKNDSKLRNEKRYPVSKDSSGDGSNKITREICTDGTELSKGESSRESGVLHDYERDERIAGKNRCRSGKQNGYAHENRGSDDQRGSEERHLSNGSRKNENSISGRGNSSEGNCVRSQIDFFNERHNYTYSSADDMGSKGQKEKFKANIAAIEMLKALLAEERSADDKEQSILSRYTGWGGLAGAFSKNNKAWSKEYVVLKASLTQEEYVSARASTTSAYFTPHFVVKAVLDYIDNSGLKKGKLLEPSLGIGHFFSHIEDSEKFDLHGVELDTISGEIEEMESNIIASKKAFEEPFSQEKELQIKLKRQSELNTILNYEKATA